MDGGHDDRGMARRASPRRSGARNTGLVLFALVTVALLAAMWLIVSTVRAERTVREEATRTNELLLALRDMSRAAINAETGQRGYLITLDRAYLAPYELGRERYPLAKREVRKLLRGSPVNDRRALVDEAERLGDAKFAEMARVVELIERGEIVAAQQAVLTDDGQKLMDRLRATHAELEASERAALSESIERIVVLEERLVPLLTALGAMIIAALALGLSQVVRAARAEAAAAQVDALAEARDRADLLARELNHRVKNMFALVLAIVRMSGKDEPAAKPALDRVAQRIHALVAAHDVTQGNPERPVVALRELIDAVLAPYCSGGERCAVEGDGLLLPAALATPLGLVLHELATNAVKYGAWAVSGGTVAVKWHRSDGRLRIVWSEHGAAPAPAGSETGPGGFGSVLIARSAQQLGGTIERSFGEGGLEVTIELPA